MDGNVIKKDFTIFQNNPKLIYLDSAATSLTPKMVVDEIVAYYEKYNAPVHRGIYDIATQASQNYENARVKIASYFQCSNNEIIFTKSTTASINNVAKSLAYLIKQGDEIIVTDLEHHSNFLPWQVLCKEKKAEFTVVKSVNKNIIIDDIISKISEKTKIIATHHMSNVIGNEIDVIELCERIKKKNKDIIILIDGAQAASHKRIDLSAIKCDFYTISAHKMYGPTGLGILYVSERVHNILMPFEYGGDMVVPSSVDLTAYELKEAPLKFEAGTPSIAEVLGFAKAIKYIEQLQIDEIQEYVKGLKKYFVSKYHEIADICDVYNLDNDSNLVTFNIKGVAVHDAVSQSPFSDVTFDKFHIALRDGQMCNNLTMRYVIGEKAVLRASFGVYNTQEDVDSLINAIKKIYKAWN